MTTYIHKDQTSSDTDLIWVFTRRINSDEQIIPDLSGWVSATGHLPKYLTIIDYYPMINAPITDVKIIQECLRCSQEGSTEAGQEYTISIFDLGVCMIAYPMTCSEPEKYHIILIGTLYCSGAYLKCFSKIYCRDSGWTEVALEAKLITTGSMSGVIEGKNWNMNTHKSTLDALKRLLYDKYIETHKPLSHQGTASLEKLSPSESSLAEVLSSADVTGHIAKYKKFRETVRNGELGETGRFWLEYLDCIWLVLALNNAIKTNDYNRYKSAISRMPYLLLCANQQNHARCLTYNGHFLELIEKTHPGSMKLLRAGAISVARSQTPGNRCHTDKTIE